MDSSYNINMEGKLMSLVVTLVFGCFIVSAICLYYSIKKENYALGCFSLFFTILAIYFATAIGKQVVMNELAKEVAQEQIPLKGQRDFKAEIQITYKDGEREPLSLIPKTTILKESK